MGYSPSGIGSTNTPTTVANQPTNYNYLGSLELQNFSVLYPDVAPDLVKRYGYQSLIGCMKQHFGAGSRTSGSSIVRHFEEDFIHGRIALDTTTGGAAGASVTYNFLSSDVLAVGQEAPYIGSGTADVAPPFPYAIIQFSDGVEAIITAVDVSAETFVAYPIDPADSLPAAANTDFAIIKGTSVQEGSTGIQSRNSRVIYYENYMMRHRSEQEITGTAGGELIWFDVPKRNGAPGLEKVWTAKAIGDSYLRHMNEMEMMLLDGKAITNTAIAGVAGFETVTKTEGLIETITNAGNVSNYTAGAMTLADLKDLTDSFLRFKAPKSHLVPCGYEFYNDINKLVREGDGADLFASGGGRIVFRQFSGGTQEVDLDIKKLSYLGFDMALMPMDLFADEQTLGGVDKYPNLGVFIPVGNVTTFLDENRDSSETVPTLNIVGKQGFGGESREYQEWLIGKGLGVANDSFDGIKWNALSEFALEVNAVNRFGIMQGS